MEWLRNKADKKILSKATGVFEIYSYPIKQINAVCNNWLLDHTSGILPIFTGNKDEYNGMIIEAVNRGKGYCAFMNS